MLKLIHKATIEELIYGKILKIIFLDYYWVNINYNMNEWNIKRFKKSSFKFYSIIKKKAVSL